MQKQTQPATSKAARKGDTGRTSSQGRKLSSGGDPSKKGNPEIDENTKNPKAESKKTKDRVARRR
jgi:hypothetical protein